MMLFLQWVGAVDSEDLPESRQKGGLAMLDTLLSWILGVILVDEEKGGHADPDG